MPRFTKAQQRRDRTPSFLAAAREFYGAAFSPTDRDDLAESMADWSELTDAEQSFALAHLQYLNLVAQAGNQRLLVQCRSLLEEVSDVLHDGLEAQPAHEPQVGDGDPQLEGALGLDDLDDEFPEVDPDDEPIMVEPATAVPAAEPPVVPDAGSGQ